MFKWGKTSQKIRQELCPDLQRLVDLMLAKSEFDMSLICGFRDKIAQDFAYNNGTSNARFGESAHNYFPSRAVDIIPCSPIDWDSKNHRWMKMVENAKECASALGIEIICGADFKKLKDYPHIEIKGWKNA